MRLFRAARISSIFTGGELGATLIEALVALSILGAVAAAFLSGLATISTATIIADEQATAESLIRSQMESVKNYAYQYDTSEYSVDPALTTPEGWAMPPPVVELVHDTDDGIQKITVTVERNGKVVFVLEGYKVDR